MNTTEQFYHHNNGYDEGYTVAVDVDFTREDLIDLLSKNDKTLYMQVGFAFLHPKDNYCKKTGREVSRLDKRSHRFVLTSISIVGEDELKFSFQGDECYLVFKTSNKSSKPHFIYGYSYERPNY